MAEKKKTVPTKVQKWLNHFSAYDREYKPWETRVEKILRRYRDRDSDTRKSGAKFNILWSNVGTLVPAVFARMPRPEVTRRFNDPDPVGRVASLLLERGLEYEVTHYPDFRATMKQAVQDRFLGGRGTAWIRYEPHMRAAALQVPEDGTQITEDSDKAAEKEELDYECAPVDYVHWKDFGHTLARTWEEVTAVWRCVYLTRAKAEERFGKEAAKKLAYDKPPDDLKDAYRSTNEEENLARVYEIWDKSTKKALWISKSAKEVLDERDDPLGLEEFFPCPRPLYATLTNESLIPTPDFSLYQDQANQLDILCERIDGLVKALKVRGVYDAANPELGRLFNEGENTDLIPVNNWAAFSEKNGLKGALDLVDLDPIARALKECYLAFDKIINFIYQLTGIADIIRGDTDPNETLGAQEIKKTFVGLRLKNMQSDVAQFASELIQLKAQVICNQFAPQTLVQISAAEQLAPEDQQGIAPALGLLLGPRLDDPASTAPNPMRAFRVEVAADSMIQIDEAEEKKSRNEFLTATASFVKNMEPAMAQMPMLAPLLMELLKFTVQGYKAGRVIEGKFDQTIQQVTKAAMAPKPDPEQQKMQMEQQAEAAKMQAELQAKQAEQQQTLQFEREKHQQEMQMRQSEMQQQMQMKQAEMQQGMQMHGAEMGMKKEQHENQMTFERQKLAAANPETAPVNAEGQAAASPTMAMAEQMGQIAKTMAEMMQAMMQMMAQMNATMKQSNAPRRLTRDPRTGEKMVVPVQMQ